MVLPSLQDSAGFGFFTKAGASPTVTLGVDVTANSPGRFHSGWVAVSLKSAGAATVNLVGAGVLPLAGQATMVTQPVTVIPSIDVLQRVEIWSDYECADGLEGRLGILQSVIECTRTQRLQDTASLNITVPNDDDASALIRQERVLRTVYESGNYEEWRIKNIDDSHDIKDGLVRAVTAYAPSIDLATRAIIDRTEVDGSTSFDFEMLGLTLREHLTAAILPALQAKGYGYFGIGAIEYLAPVDIVYKGSNALEIIQRLAAQTGTEWRVRRLGSQSYLIDFVYQCGEEWRVAQIRDGVNARGIKRSASSAEQMTRAYPQGAELEGVRASMARNRWRVAEIAILGVVLADPVDGDGPIMFDDQLGGSHGLRLPDGSILNITDSTAFTQAVGVTSTAGLSVGMLVEICRADGADMPPSSMRRWSGPVRGDRAGC